MKIFLDTASLPAIEQWLPSGLIDGITTNPSLLSKLTSEKDTLKQIIIDICTVAKNCDVSVEVTEQSPEKVYAQAKLIAQLAPNVVVKIPCHKQYYPVIKQLSQEKIPLNITLVFSLLQGLMMSKLGVKYISPFVGRLDDIDVDGISVLYELRAMIDQYQFSTEILAASIRDTRHLHCAVQAGADIATIPPSVLEKALTHPLTDAGIAQFNADWAKLPVTQFP